MTRLRRRRRRRELQDRSRRSPTTDGDVLARVTGAGTRPHLRRAAGDGRRVGRLVRRGARSGPACPARTSRSRRLVLPGERRPAGGGGGDARRARRPRGGRAASRSATTRSPCCGPAAPRGWGIAVVSGAGINAMGRHADGRDGAVPRHRPVERRLGRGLRQSSVSAVAAAVRAGDGRGPATALAERLVETFGMPVEEVAFAAHHDASTQAELLSFAPVVFETAHAGDDVARQIVERMGDEVVSFAAALLRRMQLTRRRSGRRPRRPGAAGRGHPRDGPDPQRPGRGRAERPDPRAGRRTRSRARSPPPSNSPDRRPIRSRLRAPSLPRLGTDFARPAGLAPGPMRGR